MIVLLPFVDEKWSITATLPTSLSFTWMDIFTMTCLSLIAFLNIETCIVFYISVLKTPIPAYVVKFVYFMSKNFWKDIFRCCFCCECCFCGVCSTNTNRSPKSSTLLKTIKHIHCSIRKSFISIADPTSVHTTVSANENIDIQSNRELIPPFSEFGIKGEETGNKGYDENENRNRNNNDGDSNILPIEGTSRNQTIRKPQSQEVKQQDIEQLDDNDHEENNDHDIRFETRRLLRFASEKDTDWVRRFDEEFDDIKWIDVSDSIDHVFQILIPISFISFMIYLYLIIDFSQ